MRRGRTGLCGMAPLTRTRSGASSGPQPRAAEQGCRHCCHCLPAQTIPRAATFQHRLCSPLPLTDEESREGFVGAVRAPSSPRFQGVGHQPHGGSPGTLPEPKGRCQPRGRLKTSWACGEEWEGGWCAQLCGQRVPQGGCQDLVSSPWGTLALPSRAASCRVQQGHAGIRGCARLARHPPQAPRLPLPPTRWGRGWGRAGGLLPPSAMGTWLARVSLTFPLAPSWMKAQTGW